MSVGLTIAVDARNLNRGLALLQKGYTKRTPAIAANTAAFVVAKRTCANMPAVSQNTIDTELGVTVTPIVRTTGVKKGAANITMNSNTFDKEKNAAMMIVVARMHKSGTSATTGKPNYNLLTGSYWALNLPGTSGSAAFWNWVEQAAERMVRSRHSSTAFLKSCWIPSIRALAPFASKNSGGSDASLPPSTMKFVPDSGFAKPAIDGQALTSCVIGNAAGVAGKNSVLNEKHNQALWLIAPPILQEAIDAEAHSIFKHIADIELTRERSKLSACGFKLN